METEHETLLIVGAGHAGSELAVAARQGGWPGRIVLLGDERGVPYQRPPLSKAYLLGTSDVEALALRPAAAYQTAGIELVQGARLERIDRAAHMVALDDGTTLRYDKLALCTGGRPRPFVCEGMAGEDPPENLMYLRTLGDADGIRARLHADAHLVVIGGGYVGLEVAASARGQGARVTVIEAQPRVLARVAGAEVSGFYERVHREAGVDILTGTGVDSVVCEGRRIVAVNCSNGQSVRADLVVAGIGMLPNIEAAQRAGLASAGGIPVDPFACTADPDIVAAGDNTLQYHALYGREVRLESVPNALEQARCAASWLCGKPKPHHSVPWFWSDQYDLKLQMAGLSQGHDRCVLRGDPSTRSFCAFYLQGGRLLAIDAVNRPGDFMLTRRALAQPVLVDPERLVDEALPLKEIFMGESARIQGKP
jgi:3-phenylpropionate/trans-cinnamate dioxygenase ferredoxin reductase subunit